MAADSGDASGAGDAKELAATDGGSGATGGTHSATPATSSTPPPPFGGLREDLPLGGIAKVAIGVAGFLAFDQAVGTALEVSGLSVYLPRQIGGMMSAFAGLSIASLVAPGPTTTLHGILMPGVAWVGRWLPVFLVPVQVMLPTICLPGGAAEGLGLATLLVGGWLITTVLGARLTRAFQALLPAPAAAATSPPKPPMPPSAWLAATWLGIAALALPFGLGLVPGVDACEGSWSSAGTARAGFLAALGVGSYAMALHRGIKGHICFLVCGLATAAGVMALAMAQGETYGEVVSRDYLTRDPNNRGSGDLLLWCLGPALVATGVQMFQYRARIRAFGPALLATCALVSLFNIVGTVALAPWLGCSKEVALASTMRCVTIPMALPAHDRLCEAAGTQGGVALVALCAGISGFLGFGMSGAVLSSALCGAPAATAPVARGIATGATAHALGSAAFAVSEPEAFVWGMLAMAASGVASAAWICACPPVRDLTVSLASRSSGAV